MQFGIEDGVELFNRLGHCCQWTFGLCAFDALNLDDCGIGAIGHHVCGIHVPPRVNGGFKDNLTVGFGDFVEGGVHFNGFCHLAKCQSAPHQHHSQQNA